MASCFFVHKEFLVEKGFNINTISNKSDLVEYEPKSKIIHCYPTKTKGLFF